MSGLFSLATIPNASNSKFKQYFYYKLEQELDERFNHLSAFSKTAS
jgi:hypothetical protein